MVHKLIVVIFGIFSLQLAAAESGPDLAKLQTVLGGNQPDSVSETAMPGLYEVIVGAQILYLSEDGNFAITGDVIDLNSRNNLTETRRGELRAAVVDAVGEDNMVIFTPDQPAAHTITVFTDIDCGYCRKLHRELTSYLDQGIKIRYMMFPRAGLGSESYDKAVTVWCSEDRQDAMTRSKLGEQLANKTCTNPVKEHYELGQSLGVQGTPSIILDNGQMVPGYVPAPQLTQMLERG